MVGTLAIACIGPTLDSVHFNSEQPDFGAPPPPITMTTWGEEWTRNVSSENWTIKNDGPFLPNYKELSDGGPTYAQLEKRRAAILAQDKAGSPREATAAMRALLVEMQKNPEGAPYLDDVREYVIAREEIFRAGALTDDAKALLDAMRDLQPKPDSDGTEDRTPFGDGKAATATLERLANSESGIVRAHANYELGMQAYMKPDMAVAASYFAKAASPKTERSPRALVMQIRSLLAPTGTDIPWDKAQISAGRIAAAEGAISEFMENYADSKFAPSVAGYKLRIDFLRGNMSGAMVGYLRELDTKSPKKMANVLSSIKVCSERMTAEQAEAVRKAILADPSLLNAYLDYRLFHTSAKAADLTGLESFAKQALANAKDASIDAEIQSRLAEIALAKGDNAGAKKWAEGALEKGKSPLASYVLGTLASRQGKWADAVSLYRAAQNDSRLSVGARENIAIALERSGNPLGAFEEYMELGYAVDVAYFLDARLTIPQLRELTGKYAAGTEYGKKVRYALAMRLMRKRDYQASLEVFSTIPGADRVRLAQVGSKDYVWGDAEGGGKIDILADPVQTIADLKKMEKSVAEAKTADLAAERLYGEASYLYLRRNLLFYNPSLWQGSRSFNLSLFWNDKIAAQADKLALSEHLNDHETLMHARNICLDVIKRYPTSKAAPRAYYRAACATRRLASMNEIWRSRNAQRNLYNEAAGLLDQLVKKFPKDPLAKKAKKYAGVFRSEGQSAELQNTFAKLKTNLR